MVERWMNIPNLSYNQYQELPELQRDISDIIGKVNYLVLDQKRIFFENKQIDKMLLEQANKPHGLKNQLLTEKYLKMRTFNCSLRKFELELKHQYEHLKRELEEFEETDKLIAQMDSTEKMKRHKSDMDIEMINSNHDCKDEKKERSIPKAKVNSQRDEELVIKNDEAEYSNSTHNNFTSSSGSQGRVIITIPNPYYSAPEGGKHKPIKKD